MTHGHNSPQSLLGRGDDSPSGDGHAAGGCIAAALQPATITVQIRRHERLSSLVLGFP